MKEIVPLPPDRAGKPGPKTRPWPQIVEAFWSRVNRGGEGECWLYRGYVINSGYGQFRVRRNQSVTAHRFSYALANGEIPGGLHVCHTCDTKLCVNPAHLFLGTHADNVRDMVQKGRHGSKRQERCLRGHELTEANRNTRGKCRECARIHFRAAYYNAKRKGKSWGNP